MRIVPLFKHAVIITAVIGMAFFGSGCKKDEPTQPSGPVDNEFPGLYMVNDVIQPENISAVNPWYNDTHIPAMMQYSGFSAAYRYRSQDTSAGYSSLTFFMCPAQSALNNLGTNSVYTQEVAAINSRVTNGELSITLAGSYMKIKSWAQEDYKGSLQAATIVGATIPAANEAVINDWYNNTHIPLIMKYSGVKKVVRYKRVSEPTDVNPSQVAALLSYLAIYYYGTKEEQINQATSAEWAAVQADIQAENIDSKMTTNVDVTMDLVKSVTK